MQKTLNRTLKVVAALVGLLFLLILTFYLYFMWRQNRKYEDKITVTAFYMQYACGDCSLDMRVETVSNSKYNFIIGHDILPTPSLKKLDELCNYISDKTYRAMATDSTAKAFTLTGYLHKNKHGLPFLACSGTPFFTVEKIKHGNDKQWTEF